MKKFKLAIGRFAVRIVRFLARKAKLDLMSIAYTENGITKSYSLKASGELNFIQHYLPSQLKQAKPVIFDVGSNIGDYSELLIQTIPDIQLYIFEPNPRTFEILNNRIQSEDAKKLNLGIGKEAGEMTLYFDANDQTSVQATSDVEILKTIAKTEAIDKVLIEIKTIDQICKEENISQIDLLKIDTEGFELEALEGAKEMISAGKISMIQFEFNEVNIVKRRFLKDFYDALPNFEFYRLDEKELIPLGEWSPKHEIFLFQNILAVQNK